ncbi:MAG: CHRD domain-containing protein [Sediminibacterium sp.]
MKKTLFILALACSALQFTSCSKSSSTPAPTVAWTATVAMSAKFEVPAVAGRNETATAELQILSDNTLKYAITVNNLTAGDALSAAHIHLGNAGVSGPVYIPFNGTLSGSTVTGTVQLTAGQADTIKTMESYVNVHTTQAGGGLVRGQVDSKVVYAADIVMNGANEVPAVTTTATGVAIVRMTENKKLYVKVSVSNLEAGDAMTFAHFHSGTSTVSGPVILGFYSAAADFGTLKTVTVDNTFYASLLADPLYVNAHSTLRGSGIVRGQIR